MALRVGIPRAMGYYYLYPFYKTLLEKLGTEVVVSPETTRTTLDGMESCPTDEPCVAVKLCFAHTEKLADSAIDYIFNPVLVSLEKDNFCCPKFLGVSDMIRNGLDIDQSRLLSPRIDHRSGSEEARRPFFELAAQLGVTDRGHISQAIRAAEQAQRQVESLMTSHRLTVPEAYQLLDENSLATCQTMPDSEDRVLRSIGVIGHPYILYEMLTHDMIGRLREFGDVITAEMVPTSDARAEMGSIPEGNRMWSFEAHLLGAALHLLRNHLVDRLILVGSFECGPESIVESYIENEAERQGIPFLLLTIDEQTGEAGLVTRIEAFMDTASSGTHHSGRLEDDLSGHKGGAMPALTEPMTFGREMLVGFPSMGYLDIAIRAMLEDCGTTCLPNPGTSRRAVELGSELAPEFVCFPLTATLGQMRLLLENGANTLFMVGGKGRCRLGWYAQVEETLLRRAGYEFDMVVLDSPVPLRTNWRQFRETLRSITGNAPMLRILQALRFGYRKMAAIDHAESVLHRMRAVERDRGVTDRVFDRFVRKIEQASDMKTIRREVRSFEEAVREIETEDTDPLVVRIAGEIWVVLEQAANQEIEKMLASRDDMRVHVDRELSATHWFRQHILSDPALRAREHHVRSAASRYLSEQVGGHGQETVGAAVLAREEGCDGVVHIFPFTCMPEIVAQNILVRVSSELDIPVLTFIISEQTGEAGIQTRVEAFLDLLEERRRHRRNGEERAGGAAGTHHGSMYRKCRIM